MASAEKDPTVEMLERVVDEVIRFFAQRIPIWKPFVLDFFDVVLNPRHVGKQLMLAVALETGMVVTTQIMAAVEALTSQLSSKARLIRSLEEEQRNAATQDEWMDLAERIDAIQGNDKWRSEPECPMYEQDRITARIDSLVHLMRRKDLFELMFVLRGSIGRNKFGLLHEGLFTKAKAGTKVLVETYHNVVCAALDYCCDAPVSPHEQPIPSDARLAFFNETRHAYGRTAIILSGGAALGFYHVGVVKALMENGLMPRVIGGASAGSIVCSMISTRTDEECFNDFFQMRGTDAPGHSGKLGYSFFRPIGGNKEPERPQAPVDTKGFLGAIRKVYNNSAGFLHDAKLTFQGLMPISIRHLTSGLYDVLTGTRRPLDVLQHDVDHLRDVLRENIGNFTFQEAFDRTGRILNIVVTPANKSDPPRLLNYLTAPHVLIWSAAVASASLPGVFEANRLVIKEANGWERYESSDEKGLHFRDGSMETDLPMLQLAEMFNVNHFIISQANPHGLAFGSYKQKSSVWSHPLRTIVGSVLTFLKAQIKSWVLNLVESVNRTRLAPMVETSRMFVTDFFTQEYEGRPQDISLIPWIQHRSLFGAILHLIYNPSEAEFREWIQAAERETWRLIPAIKSHIAEEVTLDRCVQRLRRRVVVESWEKHVGQVPASKASGMGNGVPSFFQSPSLVNLGGLGVGDQANLEVHVGSSGHMPSSAQIPNGPILPPGEHAIDLNSGWGGLGLRGNRSSGNLHRSTSDASGLFIEEETQANQQVAGEKTTVDPKKTSSASLSKLQSHGSLNNMELNKGYIKTTSMAKFYYRKSGSAGHLAGWDGTSDLDGHKEDSGGNTSDESQE